MDFLYKMAFYVMFGISCISVSYTHLDVYKRQDNLITPYEMLYMLEGVENNWSHISTNFEASYNSLLPGDYIFKVKAVAKDKSWQTDDATLAIHIATPFYKTWWFLLLLLMATAGAITTLYRWRINQKDKLRTVSYTHLDVYKRQILDCSILHFHLNLHWSIHFPLPVSYF